MGNPPSSHPDASAPAEDLRPVEGTPSVPVSEAGAKRYPLTPDILLRFVQDAVIGTDLAFRITSWNPGAEALYGWSEAEVLGQTVNAVLHAQYLDDEPAQVLPQFQAAGIWRGEVLQQHRDGHLLTIMASVALVRSPAGEPLGAVSVNRDISARKAAEQARQRAADRLHVLAEASRAFAEAGTTYHALLDQIAQLTAERLTAACTVRLLSEDAQWLDVCAVGHYHPATREVLRALLAPERLSVEAPHPTARAVRSGQPQLIPIIDPEALRASVSPEHQAILAQFSPRSQLTVPLRVHSHPIGSLAFARFAPDQAPFDEDDLRLAQDLADRAALAISNARLFQEVQAAQQVAAEAFARLDALITSLPTGVGYLDPALRYQLVNPALAALNGRPSAEHVGRTMGEVIPALASRLEPLARQVLATGEAVRDLELQDQPPCPTNGAAQDWLISYFPVRDAAGAVTGVGVTVTDITAITQTTAALRETERKLTTLFELLPVGVSIFDAAGTVVAMNPAQEAIFRRQQAGVAREGVLERSFFRPDGTPRPREELATERALRERQPALNVESGFISGTGELHWLNASAVPVEFSDWRVVAVASDITERMQAERALAYERQQLAAILTTMHEGVIASRPDGTLILINPAALRLRDFDPTRPPTTVADLGRTPHQLLDAHGKPLAPSELPLSRVLRGERFAGMELCQRSTHDGSERWLLLNGTPVVDADGALRLGVITFQDLTARKRDEQSLRERDEQLRLAYDAAQLGTWWRDPAVGLVHLDARAQAHFGIAADIAPGEMLLERIHPDDRPVWRQAVATTTDPTGDGRATGEYRVVHPDGSIRWLAIHARAYFAGEGPECRLAIISGTVQDITARKQAEAALQASEARFRLLAEHAQDLIYRYRLAPEPGFEYVSPSATAITGYTPEEHYADPQLGARLVAPEDRHLIDQATAAQTDGPLTLRWRRKDGAVIWTELLNRLIRDPAGQPVAIEGIARDITARKVAEAQLRVALAAEQQASTRVKRLQSVTAALGATLTLDEVVAVVLDLGQHAAGASTATLALLTPSGDALSVVSQDQPVGDRDAADPLPLDAPLPLAQAARTQTAIWIESPAMGNAQFPGFGPLMDAGAMGAYAALPLATTDGAIGVLALGFATPRPFAPEEHALLEAMAQQYAQALERARLYAEVQATHARLHHLSQRLLETQEQERRHLARELHDEVGQALTGLRLSLELARRLSLDVRDRYLGEAHQASQDLIARVRALSLDLRPAMLDDMGLLPALHWQITRYHEQTGIAVDFRQRGLEQRLPLSVETVAYRIVQEALTNVARYAEVTTVSVSLLASAERLRIQVRDAGRGFVLDEALASGHSSGLAGMQERVSLLGGTLLIETAPGAGTCITVGLPLGETHL
ncbi:MAG: PAS domain S-box protein [Chloroflexales bacterium]|nr:PAS domain S-box protein [Chloroflexales bacterium]